MAARAPSKKRAPKGRGGPALPVLPRLPVLAQRQLDVLGLALVALGTLLACVFYLELGGGRVGDALAGGAVWLLGGVGYLTPLLLFGTGTILVLGPMLPAVRPFRSGTVCLVAALVLGLAGGLFGLGPEEPARDRGFEDAAFFRAHGGIVGEALYWITRTLVSDLGAHIAFVFLLLAGVLLLTGASVAGVIVATRAGLRSTGRRIGQATSELTAVVARDAQDDAPTVRELPPGPEAEAAPPEVEPTVRAVRPRRIVRETHVEAPAVDEGNEEEPEPRPCLLYTSPSPRD